MGVNEYAIELLFDEASETQILKTFAHLKTAGFGLPEIIVDYHPHITLNVCNVLDHDRLERYTRHFASNTQSLGLELSYLGSFLSDKPVLFLGPTIKQALFDLHRTFLEGAKGLIKATRTFYEPDVWVPHCTLAFELPKPDLSAAFEIASQTHLPLSTELSQIALVEVPAGKMLYRYPFRAAT